MRWVADVDNVQPARCRYIEPMPRCSDKRGACQKAVWIEPDGFALLEKIVIWIAIDQRRHVADDQALFAIGDVNKCVEEIDRLLFVLGNVLTPGIERQRARQRNARGVFGVDARALTKRRHRRADNAFRKSFLVDVGDIEYFESARAVRSIKV